MMVPCLSRLTVACFCYLLVLEKTTYRHSKYHVVLSAGPIKAKKTPASVATVSDECRCIRRLYLHHRANVLTYEDLWLVLNLVSLTLTLSSS